MLTATMFLDSFFDVFKPIVQLWNFAIVSNLGNLLSFLYVHLQSAPAIAAIGAYGVAVVVLTIIIKLVLAPLTQWQLTRQKKTLEEQRRLAPLLAEIRKKYRKDSQKITQETMKLYREHGVNPLGGLTGCLPLVIQMPVLIALYTVFTNFAHHDKSATPFLFIPNLNDNPSHHLLIAGLPIPVLAYLVLPLLAAATTLIQSRMLQTQPSATPTEQEQQAQQMQRMMIVLSPLMIGFFALNVPAGLGLYWFVGNCVSIIQQSFIFGWSRVIPARFRSGGALPPTASSKAPPGGGPRGGGSPNGPRNGPQGGQRGGGPSSGPKGTSPGDFRKKPRR